MSSISINCIIANHLKANRRLVVPEFGAFVVKESGEVIFSELLRTDDGVLASLLREQGLSEMEIAVVIDRYKFEVRHQLQEYGYCQLDEVGTLRMEAESKQLKLYQLNDSIERCHIPAEVKVAKEMATEEKDVVAAATTTVENNTLKVAATATNSAPKAGVKRAPKPRRKGLDTVIIILATFILLAAAAAIGYGVYVKVTTNDTNITQLLNESIESNK